MSQKRTQLEIAAINSVQRSGLSNLSFRSIADDVGIKSSSVHYYFPGKSDLAAALIDKYSNNFTQQLHAISKMNINLKSKLEAFVKIFEDVINQDKFCLCGMLAAEVDTLNATNRQALINYFQNMEHWIVSTIEEDRASLATKMEPHIIAAIIVSGLEGAILIDRVDGSRNRLKSQREFIRAIVNN